MKMCIRLDNVYIMEIPERYASVLFCSSVILVHFKEKLNLLSRNLFANRIGTVVKKRTWIKMKFFASVALICAISVVCGHGAHLNKVEDEAPQGSKTASYLGEFKYLYKTYQDCAASDLSTCLKLKLYTAINRLARSNGDFKVSDSVTFVKDEEAQSPADEEEAPKTEGEIESELPRSLADKDQALNSLIFDKIVSFFENHTLKVSEISWNRKVEKPFES